MDPRLRCCYPPRLSSKPHAGVAESRDQPLRGGNRASDGTRVDPHPTLQLTFTGQPERRQRSGSYHSPTIAHLLFGPCTHCRVGRARHFGLSTVSPDYRARSASLATARQPLRRQQSWPARRRVPLRQLPRRPARAPGCDATDDPGDHRARAIHRPHPACCSHSDEKSQGWPRDGKRCERADRG